MIKHFNINRIAHFRFFRLITFEKQSSFFAIPFGASKSDTLHLQHDLKCFNMCLSVLSNQNDGGGLCAWARVHDSLLQQGQPLGGDIFVFAKVFWLQCSSSLSRPVQGFSLGILFVHCVFLRLFRACLNIRSQQVKFSQVKSPYTPSESGLGQSTHHIKAILVAIAVVPSGWFENSVASVLSLTSSPLPPPQSSASLLSPPHSLLPSLLRFLVSSSIL